MLAQVSSKKASRSGSNRGISACQAVYCKATLVRSCSVTRKAFFNERRSILNARPMVKALTPTECFALSSSNEVSAVLHVFSATSSPCSSHCAWQLKRCFFGKIKRVRQFGSYQSLFRQFACLHTVCDVFLFSLLPIAKKELNHFVKTDGSLRDITFRDFWVECSFDWPSVLCQLDVNVACSSTAFDQNVGPSHPPFELSKLNYRDSKFSAVDDGSCKTN
jgi:hypothetical protein